MRTQLQSHQIHVDEQLQTHLQETASMFSDVKKTQLDLTERAEVLENVVEDVKRIQADIEATNIKTVMSIIDKSRNVIPEGNKGTRQNLDDYPSRLHNHLDDAMLQVEKRNTTDERKQNITTQANSLLTSHMENESYIVPNAVGAGLALLN
ncbi:unnamed protein product [Mytilus coruscus]|uniref:Uncharacterized protein n=1 Tax=Mytilus coruscus TaxID=42192 RepID=A0A6J8ENI5_MYTCO|nr:unnamed protein product [Mytilus coruscus]